MHVVSIFALLFHFFIETFNEYAILKLPNVEIILDHLHREQIAMEIIYHVHEVAVGGILRPRVCLRLHV